MGVVQLQRGGEFAPYTFPDTWYTRQAATVIASVEGAANGVEWWHADWRLFYDPAAPTASLSRSVPPQMADPYASF